MPAINRRDLEKMVKSNGAAAVAEQLCESLKTNEIKYDDMPGIKDLYECLVVMRGKDKEVGLGSHILFESQLSEEAASLSSIDAFSTITSQIYFNAFTTYYNMADFTVSREMKKIPSVLTQGEKFGGVSNIAEICAPTPFGRELPMVRATEDYSESPAQLRKGFQIGLTLNLVKADATAQVIHLWERLGEDLGVDREMEACNLLIDNITRNRYNWKRTVYAAYQSSTPWVNVTTSNDLQDVINLNNAFLKLTELTDPFTGFPINTPPGAKLCLFVTPERYFQALRIKHSIMTRPVIAQGSNTEAMYLDGTALPFDFEVVMSKYLFTALTNASVATSTWFFGYPSAAMSWQTMLDITTSKALPGSGAMWARGLAELYAVERCETSYWFNPRFMTKNSA